MERALFFEDADLKGMVGNQFPATLGRLIKQKKVSVLTIVENTNVSKSYINKLRNPDEKNVNPSRRVVIDIALAINATLEETNMLLKAARYQELYTRDPAEALIIWGMLNKKSGVEIRRADYCRKKVWTVCSKTSRKDFSECGRLQKKIFQENI